MPFVSKTRFVKVWFYFMKAFQISWVFPDTVKKNFEAWRMNNLKGRCKQVWWKVIYAVHWQLWKERNNRAFGGRGKDADEIHLTQYSYGWSDPPTTLISISSATNKS
ncbi:uncharacterized protein LOC113342966 [Papaver somniferum]|uniref:uncharacterized protein LOC113342966 n=1 Tax=Papaver somniferum TaxID=3469 RepID=UPI000E6F6DB6|nr:uncharacterized protein LOC113342966 [Papaver somniferum]